MKKLLLTSTLLLTSISCFKDYKKEYINKLKLALPKAQQNFEKQLKNLKKQEILEKIQNKINELGSFKERYQVVNIKEEMKELKELKIKLEAYLENAEHDLETSKKNKKEGGLGLYESISILQNQEKTKKAKVSDYLLKIAEIFKKITAVKLKGFEQLCDSLKELELNLKIISFVLNPNQSQKIKDEMANAIERIAIIKQEEKLEAMKEALKGKYGLKDEKIKEEIEENILKLQIIAKTQREDLRKKYLNEITFENIEKYKKEIKEKNNEFIKPGLKSISKKLSQLFKKDANEEACFIIIRDIQSTFKNINALKVKSLMMLHENLNSLKNSQDKNLNNLYKEIDKMFPKFIEESKNEFESLSLTEREISNLLDLCEKTYKLDINEKFTNTNKYKLDKKIELIKENFSLTN